MPARYYKRVSTAVTTFGKNSASVSSASSSVINHSTHRNNRRESALKQKTVENGISNATDFMVPRLAYNILQNVKIRSASGTFSPENTFQNEAMKKRSVRVAKKTARVKIAGKESRFSKPQEAGKVSVISITDTSKSRTIRKGYKKNSEKTRLSLSPEKSIATQSVTLHTSTPLESGRKKSGFQTRKLLDYSSAEGEEIIDVIGFNKFSGIKKPANENGSFASAGRSRMSSVKPKKSRKKLSVSFPELPSLAESAAKIKNQPQVQKLFSYSRSIVEEKKDVTVDGNLDSSEQSTKKTRSAEKVFHMLSSKRQEKTRSTPKRKVRSDRNQTSLSSAKSSTSTSSRSRNIKKSAEANESKKAVSLLDIPVIVPIITARKPSASQELKLSPIRKNKSPFKVKKAISKASITRRKRKLTSASSLHSTEEESMLFTGKVTPKVSGEGNTKKSFTLSPPPYYLGGESESVLQHSMVAVRDGEEVRRNDNLKEFQKLNKKGRVAKQKMLHVLSSKRQRKIPSHAKKRMQKSLSSRGRRHPCVSQKNATRSTAGKKNKKNAVDIKDKIAAVSVQDTSGMSYMRRQSSISMVSPSNKSRASEPSPLENRLKLTLPKNQKLVSRAAARQTVAERRRKVKAKSPSYKIYKDSIHVGKQKSVLVAGSVNPRLSIKKTRRISVSVKAANSAVSSIEPHLFQQLNPSFAAVKATKVIKVNKKLNNFKKSSKKGRNTTKQVFHVLHKKKQRRPLNKKVKALLGKKQRSLPVRKNILALSSPKKSKDDDFDENKAAVVAVTDISTSLSKSLQGDSVEAIPSKSIGKSGSASIKILKQPSSRKDKSPSLLVQKTTPKLSVVRKKTQPAKSILLMHKAAKKSLKGNKKKPLSHATSLHASLSVEKNYNKSLTSSSQTVKFVSRSKGSRLQQTVGYSFVKTAKDSAVDDMKNMKKKPENGLTVKQRAFCVLPNRKQRSISGLTKKAVKRSSYGKNKKIQSYSHKKNRISSDVGENINTEVLGNKTAVVAVFDVIAALPKKIQTRSASRLLLSPPLMKNLKMLSTRMVKSSSLANKGTPKQSITKTKTQKVFHEKVNKSTRQTPKQMKKEVKRLQSAKNQKLLISAQKSTLISAERRNKNANNIKKATVAAGQNRSAGSQFLNISPGYKPLLSARRSLKKGIKPLQSRKQASLSLVTEAVPQQPVSRRFRKSVSPSTLHKTTVQPLHVKKQKSRNIRASPTKVSHIKRPSKSITSSHSLPKYAPNRNKSLPYSHRHPQEVVQIKNDAGTGSNIISGMKHRRTANATKKMQRSSLPGKKQQSSYSSLKSSNAPSAERRMKRKNAENDESEDPVKDASSDSSSCMLQLKRALRKSEAASPRNKLRMSASPSRKLPLRRMYTSPSQVINVTSEHSAVQVKRESASELHGTGKKLLETKNRKIAGKTPKMPFAKTSKKSASSMKNIPKIMLVREIVQPAQSKNDLKKLDVADKRKSSTIFPARKISSPLVDVILRKSHKSDLPPQKPSLEHENRVSYLRQKKKAHKFSAGQRKRKAPSYSKKETAKLSATEKSKKSSTADKLTVPLVRNHVKDTRQRENVRLTHSKSSKTSNTVLVKENTKLKKNNLISPKKIEKPSASGSLSKNSSPKPSAGMKGTKPLTSILVPVKKKYRRDENVSRRILPGRVTIANIPKEKRFLSRKNPPLSEKIVARKSLSSIAQRARVRRVVKTVTSEIISEQMEISQPLFGQRTVQEIKSSVPVKKPKGKSLPPPPKRSRVSRYAEKTDTIISKLGNAHTLERNPSRKIASASPVCLKKIKDGSKRAEATSPTQRMAASLRNFDIGFRKELENTPSYERKVAEVSPSRTRVEVIYSGSGRKTSLPSQISDTHRSSKMKLAAEEWNIKASTSAQSAGISCPRQGMRGISPWRADAETQKYNDSNYRRQDRIGPFSPGKTVTSSEIWNRSWQRGDNEDAAASSSGIAETGHTKTSESTALSFCTTSFGTPLVGAGSNVRDARKVNTEQPLFLGRQSLNAEQGNKVTKRSLFISSSRSLNVPDLNASETSGTEDPGRKEEEEESDVNEESGESGFEEDKFEKEEIRFGSSTALNHSKHSQQCTVS